MKCPSCKKEMDEQFAGEGSEEEIPMAFYCFNMKCKFWGIERTNPEYFNTYEK